MSATSIWIWDLLVIVINDEDFNTTRRFACPSSWGWTNCLRESFPHWLQLPEDLALRSVAVQHWELLPIAMAYQSQGYGSNGGSNSALPVILCGGYKISWAMLTCGNLSSLPTSVRRIAHLHLLPLFLKSLSKGCGSWSHAFLTTHLIHEILCHNQTNHSYSYQKQMWQKELLWPKTQLQTVSSWISCFLATEVTDALRLTSQGLKFSSGYPAEGGWVAGGMWCASREMSWEALLKAVALYVWVSCGIRLEHIH